MRAKQPAAIITGTIARPSSPSVRLTALPAPTITSAANGTKNQPRSIRTSLKNGKASDVASQAGSIGAPHAHDDAGGDGRDERPRSPAWRGPEKPVVGLLGDLQVVVEEADQRRSRW